MWSEKNFFGHVEISIAPLRPLKDEKTFQKWPKNAIFRENLQNSKFSYPISTRNMAFGATYNVL